MTNDLGAAHDAISSARHAAKSLDVSGIVYGPSTQGGADIGSLLYYPFLAGFAKWTGARTIVEIGTHAGGSTLALRAGQVSDGKLLTADITDLNRPLLDKAGVVKLVGDGSSEQVLDQIASLLGNAPIDILFVDGAKRHDFALAVIEGLADRCGIAWLLLDDVRAKSSIADLWAELQAAFGKDAADVSDVAPDMREIEYGLGVVKFGEDGLKKLRGSRYADLPLSLERPFDFATAFPGVPRMMRPREIRLVHNIAYSWLQGEGAIVDAGCFLGASTLGIASALDAREDRDRFLRKVHVYDAFHNTGGTFDRYLAGQAAADESWLPQFMTNVEAFGRYLNVYPGDFMDKRWVGDPIEMLFVDIAKSPKLDARIYTEFMPSLRPGKSIVIQQDFVHLDAPWIQATLGQAIDHFEVLGVEPPSLVLGLKRPIPSALMARIAAQDFTPEEQVDGVLRLYDAIDHDEARGTLLAIAAVLAHKGGDSSKAEKLIERRRSDHPDGDKHYMNRVLKAEKIVGMLS